MITLLFVILAALTQVVNSMIIRVIQARSINIFPMNVANHLAALVVSAAACVLFAQPTMDKNLLLIGGITGIFYAGSMIPITLSMGQRGLAMTVALTNLSQLIPSLVGILLGEKPAHLQILGMVLAAAAIPLMSMATATGTAIRERPKLLLAVLIFIFQGGAMSGNLIAFKSLSKPLIPSYFVVLYASGLLFSFLFFLAARSPAKLRDYKAGAIFGVFNIISTFTILTALGYCSGCIFFAAMSVLGLVASAVLGVVWWKERLQPWGWIGLTFAAAALALLNLKS
jgi:drug/metabolite transporter (DMT)-like permease